MDLDPHILQIEPPEELHKLLGCCVEWPVTKSARLVAYISLISAVCNLIIMILAQEEGSFYIGIDVILLLLEFFCVFSLFYGIRKKKAIALKPFIVCGVVWNAFLVLLLLFCVIQLFDREKFTSEVLFNLSELLHFTPSREKSVGIFMPLVLVILLGLTAAMGIWFLHIVLTTYYYFVDRKDQIWREQPETHRLIQPEFNNLIIPRERNANNNKQFRL